MREPVDTEIMGRRYRVVPLPAGKGLAILTLLTKAVARGLENVPSLADLGRVAGAAIADVLAGLDEAHVARVAGAFAEQTQCAPRPGEPGLVPLASQYDAIFAANYGEWLAWMRFCLELNFGSFTAAIRAAMIASGPAAAASETTPA